MKKLNFKYFTLLLLLLIMACESPTVGYNTYSWGNISDFKYSLGSESSIETALSFNEAWNEREFDAMKELSGDSIKFFGGNGIERDFDWIKEASLIQSKSRSMPFPPKNLMESPESSFIASNSLSFQASLNDKAVSILDSDPNEYLKSLIFPQL